MSEKCAAHMARMSYHAFYRQCFAPGFMAIDVLLKTMENPLTVAETAAALQLQEEDVREIMACDAVNRLDKNGFLTVMAHGRGALCGLYRRELTRGLKTAYRPEDIAYIYGLQEAHVRTVFERLGLDEVPADEVPALLEQIYIFILY